MMNSEITPTLLHAILNNQQALMDALSGIANWIEEKGSPLEAYSVRESLRLIDENSNVIGRCIHELMKPAEDHLYGPMLAARTIHPEP